MREAVSSVGGMTKFDFDVSYTLATLSALDSFLRSFLISGGPLPSALSTSSSVHRVGTPMHQEREFFCQ